MLPPSELRHRDAHNAAPRSSAPARDQIVITRAEQGRTEAPTLVRTRRSVQSQLSRQRTGRRYRKRTAPHLSARLCVEEVRGGRLSEECELTVGREHEHFVVVTRRQKLRTSRVGFRLRTYRVEFRLKPERLRDDNGGVVRRSIVLLRTFIPPAAAAAGKPGTGSTAR